MKTRSKIPAFTKTTRTSGVGIQRQQKAETQKLDDSNGQKALNKSAFEKTTGRKAARVALGTTENGKKRVALKAGTKASSVAATSVRKRREPFFRKAVLAAMTGVMLVTSVAPAFAQNIHDMPANPVKVEQVLKGGEVFKSPLDLRFANFNDLNAQDSTIALGDAPIVQQEVEQKGEVTQMADQALSQFETRITQILHRDAASLAMGKTPVEFGSLNDTQLDQLQDAAGDYFSNLPFGALKDNVQNVIKGSLDNLGGDTSNIETTKLKDLGDIGADIAKNFAQDLREDSPVAFYSIAGAGVAAVGAVAYTQGSDALENLGIKPEFSHDFGRTELSVRGEWDAKFENSVIGAHVARTFGQHKVGVGAEYERGDFNPSLSYAFDGEHLDFSSHVTFGDVTSGQADLHYNNGNDLSVTGKLAFGENVDDFVRLGATYKIDDAQTLTGSAGYLFETDTFDASIGYSFQPKNTDFDLQIRAGHNSNAGSHAGIGVTWSF